MISSALFVSIALFILGIAGLIAGGEMLVRGSSGFARGIGINPVVVGLTIVAFGTSSPEFIVCLIAALEGSGDITIGNIIGSNISNIALILGVSSVIRPVKIESSILKIHTPFMIALSVLCFIFSLNSSMGRVEGSILFLFLIAIIVYLYFTNLRSKNEDVQSSVPSIFAKKSLFQLLIILIGLALLLVGARVTVDQAIIFARSFGVSELLVGLTIIAVGTSLPELSTAVIASLKKEHEIIVGNVIGSNIFNLGILGLVVLISPINVNLSAVKFDLPVMLALSLLVYLMMCVGKSLSRLCGILLLIYYVVYLWAILW